MPSNGNPDIAAALRAAGVSEDTIAQVTSVPLQYAEGMPKRIEAEQAHPHYIEKDDTSIYQQPPEDPYAPKAWGAPAEEDLLCPSGQLCRVKRVDIMDLLADGLLNSVDFMTDAVRKKAIPADIVKARDAIANEGLGNLMENPEKFEQFKSSINRVVLRVVLAPKIYPIPNEGFDRVDGLIYVDSISTLDRIHIFNFAVTGKKGDDTKQFRNPADQSVGAVESVADVRTETVNLPSPPDAP